MFPARRTDIQSSHLAAQEIIASGLREQHQAIVLQLVIDHPGSTSRELAARTNALDHHQISRRLSEVEREGQIHKGDIRYCRIAERKCVEWWPTDMKAAMYRELGLQEEDQ
jgi:hypothetical protein